MMTSKARPILISRHFALSDAPPAPQVLLSSLSQDFLLLLLPLLAFVILSLSLSVLVFPLYNITKKTPRHPEMRPSTLATLFLTFSYSLLTTAHLTPYIQTRDTNRLFSNPFIIPAPYVGIVYSTITVTGCPTPSPSLHCVGTVYSTITVTAGTVGAPSIVGTTVPLAMSSSSKEVLPESPTTTNTSTGLAETAHFISTSTPLYHTSSSPQSSQSSASSSATPCAWIGHCEGMYRYPLPSA